MAVKTIGTNSRDYIDLDAWLADLPTTLIQQEIAEMYNDSEFTTSSGIVISGITTTPTFNMIIRPASGEAFNDTEQALRYNQANGVGIRKTTNYGTVLYINGVKNVTLENMQIVGGLFRVQPLRLNSAENTKVHNCILKGTPNLQLIRSFLSANTEIINNLIINTSGETTSDAIGISGANWKVINNTIVSLSPVDTGISDAYGASSTATVKNNTFFNYSTPITSSSWNSSNVDFNATDSATIEGGSNNLTSLVVADQFEDLTPATLDLRLKTGNDLDGAGTPESSFTNDLDIFFNARSATTPSIGAYETVSGGGGVTANGAVTLPSLVFSGSATDSTSEVTANGAVTLPSLVFSGSATDSTSEVTANGAVTLPSLVFSGSATDSTSEVTANGAVTLPSLVFSGSATDSTSEVTANGAVTLPSLVFSGSATDSTSEVTANGAVTLPSLVFSGSATDSTSGVTANGAVTLPSLVFSGSATDSTSEVTANGAVTLPSLVFSGSATDSTSGVTANGAVTLPSLVFSGSATDSTSEVTANGAVTLPSLVFAGVATIGEITTDFDIIIDVSVKTIQTTPNNFTIEV